MSSSLVNAVTFHLSSGALAACRGETGSLKGLSFNSDRARPVKKKGGPEFFGWGEGAEITKPLSAFTRQSLEAAGWTRDRLLELARHHRDLARVAPENVAAPVRAQRLEALAELFK
jgi:hypothetical protein